MGGRRRSPAGGRTQPLRWLDDLREQGSYGFLATARDGREAVQAAFGR
ncbi:MAG TPA: hypothetical protein VG268_16175 [Streptosporangiaceae bacterium]|nr:hypothetical protein [Streptosporangiaceae bacterium]